MRPLFVLLFAIALLNITPARLDAQSASQPQEGDPPVAALIAVSPPDENGIVTISGAQGAVFPNAQVTLRNLFTGETVYITASFNGAFSAQIYGPGQTPFAISPAVSIPINRRDQPGSLPGGPATIIYGANPEPRIDASTITSILIDGDLNDWLDYPDAALGDNVYGLINADSLYIGVDQPLADNALFVAVLTINATTYELTVNPATPQASLLREIAPFEREAVAVAVAVTQESGLELRTSLRGLTLADIQSITLEQVFSRTGDAVDNVRTIGAILPRYDDERDGVVFPDGRMSGDFTRFYMGGTLAAGASFWSATGRIDTTEIQQGETLTIEMDITLRVPDLSPSQAGLSIIGEIGLQPVTTGANGDRLTPAMHTNNGWSNYRTPSGLAIDNMRGDVMLGTVSIPPQQVIRRGDTLSVGLRLTLNIPSGLPDGLYVPTFTGYGQIGDGERFRWEDASLFGDGGRDERHRVNRLPVVFKIGAVEQARLAWTLFHDHPSDGSRGILPDGANIALSNRVRFNSNTYILPPGNYPLEPYLLNQLTNAYDITLSPLLPLLFPGGRVRATITAPDGNVDALPDASITQNRLSTRTLDERDAFGAQPPVDTYRLMTGNPSYQAYPFDQYGDYTIQLTGNVDDVSGNRYEGGGTYHLLIAELLDMAPGVLPGTPFNVGDAFFGGGQITPGFPAEVTIRLQVFPLNGDPVDLTFETQADRFGYFALSESPFVFEQAGEYLIDYDVRYNAPDGRLWAASLRSAGVIASNDRSLIAHGQRGVRGMVDGYRPAWFDTRLYPPLEALADVEPRPNYPYFAGDTAFLPDTRISGLNPTLHIQDTNGTYRNWLQSALPDYVAPFGLNMTQLAQADELPLLPVLGGGLDEFGAALLPDLIVNRAYAYISAVRPDVTVRQYVLGQSDDGLLYYWDNDDPLNQQIGAGIGGNRAGDYIFLFGGTVIKNAEANVRQIAPYAALAIITAEGNARIAPPLQGADSLTIPHLLTIRGQNYDAFFHPTSIRPGQTIAQGSIVAITGQAAPTLQTGVDVTIIAPDGERIHYNGMTNESGYFYDPAHDFIADRNGEWRVQIITQPDNALVSGTAPNVPVGGVPAVAEFYSFYVIPDGSPTLSWSLNGDVDTSYAPGARLNVSLNIPSEWSDTRARYEVTTASYPLDSGDLQVFASQIAFQYDPAALANEFPLETSGGGVGARGGDVVTITFIINGSDVNGSAVFAVRRLYIFHDRILSVDEQVLEG